MLLILSLCLPPALLIAQGDRQPRARPVAEAPALGECVVLLHGLARSAASMQVMARACGHRRLSDFNINDLTTFKQDMAALSGVAYAGVSA